MVVPRAGDRRQPLDPVEILPGLVVRLLAEAELPAHIAAVEASGFYANPTDRLTRWWRSPLVWPTVVAWRGRILQYDYFHLVPPEGRPRDILHDAPPSSIPDPVQVWAGLTLRPERNRPRWFWREVRRPVLARLLAAGARTMTSAIRADRRDWVEVMKLIWRAEETGASPDGRWVHLRYDVATALGRCQGWPARRTVGPAWRWQEGPLVCREASAEDLPAVDAWLAQAWGLGHPRLALARGLLDDRWHLDRAALLIASDGAGLRAARTIHWRWDHLAGQTFLGPLSGTAVDAFMGRAAAAWQLAVGYERSSIWVSPSQARAAVVLQRLQTLPAPHRPEAAPDGMVDVQWDLRVWARDNALHPYDDGEWGGAPHALTDDQPRPPIGSADCTGKG